MKRMSLGVLIVFALLATVTVVAAYDPSTSGTSASQVAFTAVKAAAISDGDIMTADTVSAPDCAVFQLPEGNHDEIVTSNGLSFAERFNGQTLSYSGDFDVLSGAPSNPLNLQVGLPNQNLGSWASPSFLAGLGYKGWPSYESIGEGSVAVQYPTPQKEVTIRIHGADDGAATLKFFKADGSSLGTLGLSLGTDSDKTYQFKTISGNALISGISIENTDAEGIGFDSFCYTNQGTTPAPEFPSVLLPITLVIGILGVVLIMHGTRKN